MSMYTFSTFDIPGATDTTPNGLNDHGQIVGSYVDSGGHTRGFLDTNGKITNVNVKGATSVSVNAINNLGEMVGNFVDAHGATHGFLDNHGVFTTIDMPGATETFISGINDSGQMVGQAQPSTPHLIRQDVFEYSGGTFTTIAVPGFPDGPPAPIGGTYLWAGGISNNGWITITAHNAPGTGSGAAFIDENGTFVGITPPGAALPPVVNGISSTGVVVGGYSASNGQHGYIDANGKYTVLTDPNGSSTDAAGINKTGEVIGVYTDAAGHTHGFIAKRGTAAVTAGAVVGARMPGFLRG